MEICFPHLKLEYWIMDKASRKLISALIQLAEADKHFAKAEREMIYRIAKEKNFNEESVTELIKNPEPIDSLSSLTQDEKFEYLYSCIALIFADHNIFESEIVLSKSMAIKLGFRRDVVDYFVQHFKEKSKEELKPLVLSQFV